MEENNTKEFNDLVDFLAEPLALFAARMILFGSHMIYEKEGGNPNDAVDQATSDVNFWLTEVMIDAQGEYGFGDKYMSEIAERMQADLPDRMVEASQLFEEIKEENAEEETA